MIINTQFVKNRSRVFYVYPYEGYRSVTPLDAARVNRTIFHNHSVHWYYITLIEKNAVFRRNDTWSCRNRPIPTICTSSTAAAVDTACARGSVLLITFGYTSMSTHKGVVCLSKRYYSGCLICCCRGYCLFSELCTVDNDWYIYQY